MAVTPIDAGRIMPLPKGEYNASTPYEILDIVTYGNSLYMASQSTTGNLPTNTTYWVKLIEGIIVDSALSSSSTNPLQNKVVKSELDKKANTSSLGTAASKNSTTTVTSGSDALPTGDAVNTAIANAISAVYKPSGSVAFASLPTLSSSVLGNVYNVTDAFTTTSDFIEGAGKSYPAGTNVVVVQPTSGTYKFDVLSGFVDLSNYIQKSLTSGLIKNDGTIDTNTYLTSQDITRKADKVTSATNGNFAGLDSNGNLTDSGSKASDFLTSSSLTNYVTKSETAGLIKNDGTIDTTSYAKQSEMSVTNGTGTDADKTTIQLKSGTSATVLKSHQDVSGKANKTETVSTVGWDSTNKKIIQTINNVLYDVVTGETILNNLTQSQVTTALGYTPCDSSDLGTAASKDVASSGDASNTQVVMGNDSRLSDARTPSNDSNLVHKTGDETIAGTKTFNEISTTYLSSDSGYITINDDINANNKSIIGSISDFIFSPYKSYAIGDYCYYVNNGVGKVYKFTSDHISGESWNISEVVEVPNSILIKGDVIANGGKLAKDSGVVHKTGDEIIGGTKIFYNITTGDLSAVYIDSVRSITVDNNGGIDLDLIINQDDDKSIAIAVAEYDSETAYNVGDYVTLQNKLYRCTTDNPVGGFSPNNFTRCSNMIVTPHDISVYHATVNGDFYVDYIYPKEEGDVIHINSEIMVDGDIESDNNISAQGSIYTNQLDVYNGQSIHSASSIDIDGNLTVNIPAFSSSTAYTIGTYVMYEGKLYKCTTTHSAGAWNSDHFTFCSDMIATTSDIVANTLEATGSDYAERFETLEECPNYRFVTLEGEKIKLAQSSEDYILGIISENPSIIGDKDNSGVAVGLLGKLWVEQDGTAKINDYVTTRENGIATKADSGYRVMKTDGNKILVLFR